MRNKVPTICKPSMNEHTQSGIYDLAQTPSGEIIRENVNIEGVIIDEAEIKLSAYAL